MKKAIGILSATLIAMTILTPSLTAQAADRVGEQIDKLGGRGPSPAYVTDANQLVQALVGPNVQIANATLISSATSTGIFTGGSGVIGFDAGVVLSSGDIAYIQGPNQSDGATGQNGLPGDPDLDALIPGYVTFDATILEFDFLCTELASFTFQYVFASEEYNEFVDFPFNDVFAFFLNGTDMAHNVAVVPGFCSDPGLPVSINNVNCGFSEGGGGLPGGPNCSCFNNNDLQDGGGSIDTEMDGLTSTFFATGNVNAGEWNHIKIAIADAGDDALDSVVLIKGESFDCGAAAELGACCDGDDCHQLTFEDCVSGQYDPGWIGVGVPCDPNPCDALPVCDAGGPYSGDAGVPIQFDGSASYDPNGTIILYEWDFGDGDQGTGVAPTHTYEEDGEYVVTLCITDNHQNRVCCSVSPVVPTIKMNWSDIKGLYR